MIPDDRDGLIDEIYEAALFPERWSDVLQRIETLVDGAAASIRTWRPDSWERFVGSPDAEIYREQFERSAAATARRPTAALIAMNRAGFVAEHELMRDEEFLSDPLMTAFGTPAGFRHAAGTLVLVPGGDAALLNIWRRAGKPRFSRADLTRLDTLRPHLARAALLTTRLKFERMRAKTEALEVLGIPAAVLEPSGRVLVANQILQAMKHHIAWLARDRLALRDKGAGEILRATIERAASTGSVAGRSFAARGPDDAGPVVVHIVPLNRDGRELFERGLFLMAVSRLEAGLPNSSLLQGLYDFTAAEARIAAGLLDGKSASELCLDHKVSISTVRAQIRAILSKSGVSRQREFIAKLRGVSLALN